MNDDRHQQELDRVDAFLDDLSQGIDPSEGTDPLAGMLLELRSDVAKPMPEPPQLQAQVVELKKRRMSPVFAGLLGAAAATVVIAGSGAVLFNAGPDSPLYGLSTTLFPRSESSHDVVELASTLDEMNDLAERGDMDGVRLLIEQARFMAKDIQEAARVPQEDGRQPDSSAGAPRGAERNNANRDAATTTVTVTTTVPAPGSEQPQREGERAQQPAPAPATEPRAMVTETVTQTVTTTVTVPGAGLGDSTGAGAVSDGEPQAVDPTAGAASPVQEALVGSNQDQTDSLGQQEGAGL
ncbi:hypothetical protein Clow_00517 [Corynebacterium lowii]|uniref:Anti-sigma-D factor RsdA n=2 Tax=Corynebacterium lowii TaxID=1544413 RepID=A0A0N8W0R8_9CORY|nr:hypothetical protein Clow_00517 [Corynebacterium lowii]